MTSSSPFLIVPGLGNSGPDHWQTHWERQLSGARRVVQNDWDQPVLAEWVTTLASAIEAVSEPVLVVHSLGCALVAHVAARRPDLKVRGALLVSPSDVESEAHTPPEVRGFAPMPLSRLPFPALVVASTNDPFVAFPRARQFAQAWGAQFESLDNAGHINAGAGYGPWPEGLSYLDRVAT